jgi:hypothetical protein
MLLFVSDLKLWGNAKSASIINSLLSYIWHQLNGMLLRSTDSNKEGSTDSNKEVSC